MALGRGHLRRDSALRWRASRSASRSNTAATVRSDRTWSRSPVRPVTWRSRVSGSWPCSAASVRHRPYKVSAAWWSLGLRVAWTAHLTSRGSAPAPRPPAAPPPGQSGPFAWSPAGPGPRAGPPAPGSRRRPLLSTRPRASGTAGAGSWPDRWHRRPADADTGPAVQRCPAAVRPLDPVGHHQVGCSSGSPSRDVRWSNPTPSSPCPATCSCPPWPRRVPMWVSR